jgi:type II secretory pathway component PulJ
MAGAQSICERLYGDCGSMRQRRNRLRGFTLIEALLAAAVLGISGYVLALAFHNGQLALVSWDEKAEVEKLHDWAIGLVSFRNMSLEDLEKGGTLRTVEGYRMDWKAQPQPTAVLDVFEVRYELDILDSQGRIALIEGSRIERNSEWYRNAGDRERLVEEIERRFERIEREREDR